jgi:protein-glutamine gamma-glutamyltransferase
MYDIRQFKPTLYLLLLIGMTGFALAARSPALWLVGAGGVLLNGWLVFNGRFSPLPRWVANLVTLMAFAFAAIQFRGGTTAILVVGQFLVLLQLVKLFEQRANRDYAQLLILSLLLMVAAAINTASLLFALLLIAYLFLSLYSCLLFHLKVETDEAQAAISIPQEKMNLSVLRQDQRYLSRSMRRLTGIVAMVAVTFAVAVFLFFPRGTGAGVLVPLQMHPKQSLTGFSEEVSFQQVAQITQSNELVATIEVFNTRTETRMRGGSLLLRGMVLDVYQDAKWTRSRAGDERERSVQPQGILFLTDERPAETWRQVIRLEPTGTNVLFAMAGPINIRPAGEMSLWHSMRDDVVMLVDPLRQPITYEVESRGAAASPAHREEVLQSKALTRRQLAQMLLGDRAPDQRPPRSHIPAEIAEYARRTDVVGDLVAQRGDERGPHALDEEISRRIEQHLRTQFTYTLDLTDARRQILGQDPLVWFLSENGGRGHCEYFAGAMALMCQSLGMEARVVVGFHSNEYNPYGGYYRVRQSHAHAWVEVLTPEGWKTFDPTSGTDSPVLGAIAAGWTRLRQMFDYLEHAWATSVVAYDQDSRQTMIATVDQRMMNAAMRSGTWWNEVRAWLSKAQWWIASQVLGALVAMTLVALFAAIAWFLWEKWKLRRRVVRIGIDALPASDRVRLARQLAFYDELVQLLERQGIARPRHLTPMEFSRSLVYLPREAYESIGRMTDIFYRIRYGRMQLTRAQRRRLINAVSQVEQHLGPVPQHST